MGYTVSAVQERLSAVAVARDGVVVRYERLVGMYGAVDCVYDAGQEFGADWVASIPVSFSN